MPTYNQKPRPRAFFIGFDEEDLLGTGILELFPTYRFIEIDQLDDIHQSEYEVAIVYDENDLSALKPNLYVVTIAGHDLGRQEREEYFGKFTLEARSSVATEIDYNPLLEDAPLQALAEQTLLPLLVAEPKHHTLHSSVLTGVYAGGQHYEKVQLWTALFYDRDGEVLSGYAYRSATAGIKPELWYLHPDLSFENLKRWLEFLLDRWAEKAPDLFPNSTSWKRRTEWQSAEEKAIDGEIAELRKEHASAQKTYESKLTKLEAQKIKATTTAEKSIRLLLTAQGDTLKDAVKRTLESFGFTVEDVDEIRATNAGDNKSDKLEDLRVKAAQAVGLADWIALTEVRGYAKGAKLNDLIRLGRFTNRYMQESGGIPPDAVWYIANHDLQADPKGRELALQSSPDEVREFSENAGLVIDTVELFKLKRAVDIGTISQEEARRQLAGSVEYFKASSLEQEPEKS